MKKNYTPIRKYFALIIFFFGFIAMVQTVFAQPPPDPPAASHKINVLCSGHGNGKVPEGTTVYVYPVDENGNPESWTCHCLVQANSCAITGVENIMPLAKVHILTVTNQGAFVSGLDPDRKYKAGFSFTCSTQNNLPCVGQGICDPTVNPDDKSFKTNATGGFLPLTIYFNCPPRRMDEGNYQNEKLLISPNPARDQITIDNGEGIITKIDVYNSLGAKILSLSPHSANAKRFDLDISNFSRGFYLISVTGEERERIGKFVKE